MLVLPAPMVIEEVGHGRHSSAVNLLKYGWYVPNTQLTCLPAVHHMPRGQSRTSTTNLVILRVTLTTPTDGTAVMATVTPRALARADWFTEVTAAATAAMVVVLLTPGGAEMVSETTADPLVKSRTIHSMGTLYLYGYVAEG